MNRSLFKFISKLAVLTLFIIGLIELALALWTVLENRYKSLAYNLADVGYIDLWVLRYISMCLFASSIITIVMCLILLWGLYSAHVFIFIASTMISLVVIAEFTIGIITFSNKFQTRLTLQDQLPKLVITYRQGNDERASRALDILQSTFRCCGSDGRLSFQNNVPLSCNMYSIGCLTRTMFFLDSCMDALAYVLLLFSLIKLLIVIFFYSLLCVNQRHHEKHSHNSQHSPLGSNRWRQSSSFDAPSTDPLPKKILITPPQINASKSHENEYVEKRRVILNDYDSQSPNKRVQNGATILSMAPALPPTSSNNVSMSSSYDQQLLRKLSTVSEKTEKTETSDSDPDLLRVQHYHPKRKTIITTVDQKQLPPPPLPKKLPTIKSRRTVVRDDENDHDSGVERSSSEKSFEEQNNHKRRSGTPSSTDTSSKSKSLEKKSPPTLSFSNVFVTSVSQGAQNGQSQEDDVKKPLTASPSTSSSCSDQLLLTGATTPKPILKKSQQQSSPSSDQDRIPPSYQDQKKISPIIHTKPYVKLTKPALNNSHSTKIHVPYKTKTTPLLHSVPKPAPRPSLKQPIFDKQDESLV